MDWVLAIQESKKNIAYRVDKDGNIIKRYSNGEGYLIYKNPYMKSHKLEEHHVAGYNDWEPV